MLNARQKSLSHFSSTESFSGGASYRSVLDFISESVEKKGFPCIGGA